MNVFKKITSLMSLAMAGLLILQVVPPAIVYAVPPSVTVLSPANGLVTSSHSHVFAASASNDATSCKLKFGSGAGDFENNSLDGWATGGNANWVISTDAHTGSYSAKSGNLINQDNVQSWISKDVVVPSDTNISFYWKVGSEEAWDKLKFEIDGAYKTDIDGDIGWTQVSLPISAGNHSIRWEYTKDFSVTRAPDSGWIDDIRIEGLSIGTGSYDMLKGADDIWRHTVSGLADGSYSYSVECTNASAETGFSEERNLTIDTSDTTPPTIPSLLTPTNGKHLRDSNVAFDWTDATDNSGVVTYEFFRSQDENFGDNVTMDTTESSIAAESISFTAEGLWYWRVRAKDPTGNYSDYSQVSEFTIDHTNPVIMVTPQEVTIERNSPYDLLTGVSITDADTNLTVNDIEISGDTLDVTRVGTYQIYYDLSDTAGNEANQVSRTVNVIDTTAPIIGPLIGGIVLGGEVQGGIVQGGTSSIAAGRQLARTGANTTVLVVAAVGLVMVSIFALLRLYGLSSSKN